MDVRFRNRRLENYYVDFKFAQRNLGRELARSYLKRVEELRALERWELATSIVPWRCHPLKGNRRGEWAIKLDGFHRLIVSVKGEEMEIVTIEEISKHYGD